MRRIWALIVCCIVTTFSSAQFEPGIVGPALALSPANHDRILLYDVASDTFREIDFGARWHIVWDFSPDGCRILFTLSDDATSPARLYSARLDGSDLRELVQYSELPAAQWSIWEPQWSPEGSKIAFRMTRDREQRDGTFEREHHIAWVEADGGEAQFYSVTGAEHEPRWSPDGAWLAYISFEERAAGADINATAVPTIEPPPGTNPAPPTLLSEADLWLVSNDGETKFRLTRFDTGSVRNPRWSPDSELISFTYSPSPNNDTFWMISRLEGAIPTQLNFNWALILDTTWLPDSTQILGAARDFRGASENRLWSIPLVGNADENAAPYIPNVPLTHADYPRFSADGRYLAARSAYALALVDLETGLWRLLDREALANTPPVWSPPAFQGESDCRLSG